MVFLYRLDQSLRVSCRQDDDVWFYRLLGEDEVRLVLTDVPYNVPIKGHVTKGSHREFAMASGEMSRETY